MRTFFNLAFSCMNISHLNYLFGTATSLVVSFSWLTGAQAAALKFDLAQRSQPAGLDRNRVRGTHLVTGDSDRSVVLDFALEPRAIALARGSNVLETDIEVGYSMGDLFAGGSNSLVARAVGSAEGTRTPNGGYTSAYYGHVDPGNGLWNLGSFSYQHGAVSPEQADRKQLQRLKRQTKELHRQTRAKSLQLSLLEELNGIDLANQAPLAALDRGYVDWLFEAQSMELRERVVWARTKAFIDPDTGYWDAPGLGNHWDSIYRDQLRRYDAIARTLETHNSTKRF